MKPHVVDVMRPAASPLGSRGQPKGQDAILFKDWQCEVTWTGTSEGEQSGGEFAEASYEVTAEGCDPDKPILPSDYLLFRGKRLNIASITDTQMNGRELILTCGEHLEPVSG